MAILESPSACIAAEEGVIAKAVLMPGRPSAGEICSGALSGKPGVLQYRAEYAGLYRHL